MHKSVSICLKKKSLVWRRPLTMQESGGSFYCEGLAFHWKGCALVKENSAFRKETISVREGDGFRTQNVKNVRCWVESLYQRWGKKPAWITWTRVTCMQPLNASTRWDYIGLWSAFEMFGHCRNIRLSKACKTFGIPLISNLKIATTLSSIEYNMQRVK